MPGVHSDVGGGYRDSFLSKISLITMLDRLKEHTDIKINGDMILQLQRSIKENFEAGSIAINDEFEGWPWSIFRRIDRVRGLLRPRLSDSFVKQWCSGRTLEDCNKFQFYHPVCKTLEGRFVQMKWAKYPQKYTMKDRPQLKHAFVRLFDEIELR